MYRWRFTLWGEDFGAIFMSRFAFAGRFGIPILVDIFAKQIIFHFRLLA
jgi:hypothetical protein